jgi:hypothetical protein
MSDGENSPTSPDAPAVPSSVETPRRRGWLTAFMVLIGMVMLLPGLCAMFFGAASINSPNSSAAIMPFVFVGGLIGLGGILLIWAAIQGARR